MSIVKVVIMAALAMPLIFGLMGCGGSEESSQGGAAPEAAAQEKTESTKPASEPPRNTAAFPDFKHSAAASAVTLGRDS